MSSFRQGALRLLRPLGAVLDAPRNRCSAVGITEQRWQLPQWAAMSRLMSSLPPHTELTMPALSPTMAQGNIASWQVKEGDEVAAGDVLCDVETDKATMAWENQDDGFVAKLLLKSGAKDVPVGTPVLILVEDEEHVASFKDYKPESDGGAAQPPPEAEAVSGSSQPNATSETSGAQQQPQLKASSTMGPAARILLQGAGLSASDVQPSGPNGIITKGDVLAAIEHGVQPKQKPAEQSAAKAAPAQPPARAAAAPAAPKPSPAQEQQPQQQPQQHQRGQGRPQVPDSQIRALLANSMLEKGEQIPAAWLRDWVGPAEGRS